MMTFKGQSTVRNVNEFIYLLLKLIHPVAAGVGK